MKKLLSYCIFLTAISGNLLFANDTLRHSESVTRQLILEFNEKAKQEDAFITWQFRGDEWENVNVSANQGRLRGHKFTIRAREYQDFVEGVDGIVLTITPRKRIEQGSYDFRMDVYEVSPELRILESDLNLRASFYLIPKPPTPWWLTLLYILGAAFIVFHIVWFAFLKNMFYPKMKGILQFSDGSIIKLNDCYNYVLYTSHKKPAIAKDGVLAGIYCGKKGSFQMPYPDAERNDNKYVLIKAEKGRKGYFNKLDKISDIEFLSSNKKLYHEEEYSFKDKNDDMTISFTYDNIKHQM